MLTMIDQQKNQHSALEDVQKYGGHSMAYSTLAQGIQHFRHPSFQGFIAYKKVWGYTYVLSNPITPFEDYARATRMFLKYYPKAIFCQVSLPYANMLHYLGLHVQGFGVEHLIAMNTFECTWRVRRNLKRFSSRLSNLGYRIEVQPEDVSSLNEISREWLDQCKNKKELSFLARAFESVDEKDIKLFTLTFQGQTLGFCTFDPIYENALTNSPTSYVLQFLRTKKEVPSGAGDYLILKALEYFKREEFSTISLGLSPLYKRDNGHFHQRFFPETLFRISKHLNQLYHFQSLGEHKDRYQGTYRQTYIASTHPYSFKGYAGMFKVNQLI